jgi:ADP-heptose:LPS heptosyltransferase
MKRCRLFVGNDTGTMHMAAAVGLPCVAIFSSRERPGLWYPRGTGHKIFRTTIDCEGSGLIECLERGNECINRITKDEVRNACRRYSDGAWGGSVFREDESRYPDVEWRELLNVLSSNSWSTN